MPTTQEPIKPKVEEPVPITEAVAPDDSQPPQQVPRYRELISKRYPDRQFETDTDAENALYEDYEQVTSKLEESEISNKRIYEIIEANPSFSDIILDLDNGMPLEVALARNVDLEALIPEDGEPNYDQYQEAVNQRRNRQKEIEGRRKTIEENQGKTKAEAEAFFASEGLDQNEQTAFVDWLDQKVTSLFNGYLSQADLKQFYKGFKYDDHIEQATEQGVIDGRNQSIEAKRTTNSKTDGIPTPGSGIKASTSSPKNKIFNF